jgi:hypothetical protein
MSLRAAEGGEAISSSMNDSTAKRVLYRRDRRVRRAILKKISALSAFSAMSFCSEFMNKSICDACEEIASAATAASQ